MAIVVRSQRRALRADPATVAVDVFVFALKVFLGFFAVWALVGTIALQAEGGGLSVDAWRDVLVGGLATGSMYGLIALGYSMVYGILGFINFAHGEVFMTGALSGYLISTALFESGMWEQNFLLSFVIIMIGAALTSTIVAITIERVAYRRLRGAPRLIPLITSIGVSFFIQYAVLGLFGGAILRYPQLPTGLRERVNILGFAIEGSRLVVIIVAAVSVVVLWWFVTRSKSGRAIRAVAEDKEIAGLMGIDVDRTIIKTFALGGAMAGVAGIMWALMFRNIFYLTGFLPGIKAFTAAVLGGIGNLPGAMLGGLTLGMFESAGPTMLSSLRWSIPPWVAYAIGVLALATAVRGFLRWRGGHVRETATAVSWMVVGTAFALLAFTQLPDFQVVIPGTSQLKDMIAFIVLIGVLMIRPVGLLGERLAVEERG